VEKERISMGQSRLHLKGEGPSAPHFGGSFLFTRIPFIAELSNLTW